MSDMILQWLTPILAGGSGIVVATIIFITRMSKILKSNKSVEERTSKTVSSVNKVIQEYGKMYDIMQKQIADLSQRIAFLVEAEKKRQKGEGKNGQK